MVNLNIDLPSKRAKIVMEIEKPLRRQFRSKTDRAQMLYMGILIGIVLVTILHFFVEPRIAAAASYVPTPGTIEELCMKGMTNHEIDLKALSANMRELCD